MHDLLAAEPLPGVHHVAIEALVVHRGGGNSVRLTANMLRREAVQADKVKSRAQASKLVADLQLRR